jgi:hypothetical protein
LTRTGAPRRCNARILADQHYDADTRAFFYASLGRLFFRVKELDADDKLMVIHGAGPSGKSTIARALEKLLGHGNVGMMPSRSHASVLHSLVDKALWLTIDSHNLEFDTGMLTSMAAGDVLTGHPLFRDSYEVPWTVPGLATTPPWSATTPRRLSLGMP